jgi:hypothetical protein
MAGALTGPEAERFRNRMRDRLITDLKEYKRQQATLVKRREWYMQAKGTSLRCRST